MKLLSKYFHISLLAVAFYSAGFVVPWDLDPNGTTVSVAEAHHRPGHTCSGGGQSGCGTPPSVSELPIQYMVAGGLAFIVQQFGICAITAGFGAIAENPPAGLTDQVMAKSIAHMLVHKKDLIGLHI